MWKIWKEELRKIASRKLFWVGLALLLAFITFQLWSLQEEYSVTIGGQRFYGKEAIKRDQKLTSEYAGILTEEKGKQIYDRYGIYDDVEDGGERNFCNYFITYWMTNYGQARNGDLEELRLYEGEEWEWILENHLEKNLRFDYSYGWKSLWENYGILVIQGMAVLLLIVLSPVFAEEYMLKTADILMTTQRGKGSGIRMKMLAAFFFAAAAFLAVTLYVWAIYIAVFGVQGLDASAALIGDDYGYCPSTIGGYFLFMFLQGLAGILLLTCIVLAVSAMCRNSFLAVVVSLALYLFPLVYMEPQREMWVLRTGAAKGMIHFMMSMPVYLSLNWAYGFSGKTLAWHFLTALAAGAVCLAAGRRKYKDYQG